MGRRGPKKGWKKALQKKTRVKVVKDESGQVIDSTNDPIFNSKQDSSISFEMNDREAMYAKADEHNHGIIPEEVEEEVVEAEPTETTSETVEEEIIEQEEETTESVPEETESETSTETEEAETGTPTTDFIKEVAPVEEKKPEEAVKTVPLAALHESREKDKAKAKRIEELERQLADKSGVQQTEQTQETEDYVDPETADLRRRLDDLEGKERANKKAQDKLDQQNNVKVVHESLMAEGITGYDKIGWSIVKSTLQEMYQEDPVNAVAHDTAEGHAKIYLEALPDLQAIGREQHKTEIFDKKKVAKKEANLITTSGKKLSETEQPKKKLTPQEAVMKEVRSNRIT